MGERIKLHILDSYQDLVKRLTRGLSVCLDTHHHTADSFNGRTT